MELNFEQHGAVERDGNVVVTACPGSGKTRVLTARVIRGVGKVASKRERVAALTFTNRAADEIRARFDQESVPTEFLWAGTIHAFALEWILRPYAPYSDTIRNGFSVADEYFCERLLRDIRTRLGLNIYTEIKTDYLRNGSIVNSSEQVDSALVLYKEELRQAKLIDYNEVVYLAFRLVAENPEIAATLGSIFRVICVDEVQDIQDLQFGILSEIYKNSANHPEMFFVGDSNQSIYESLGALTKSPEEIASEFGMAEIHHFELLGNYRSTQRIVELCRLFRPGVATCESRIARPGEHGTITFSNQSVHKDDLCGHISAIIGSALEFGIPESEICVVAPQWGHVRAIARKLAESLPQVSFDAPGLSPLYSVRDSIWFKFSKLFLTDPTPSRIRSRVRCASEILVDLEFFLGSEVPDIVNSSRRLLRLVNQLASEEEDGVGYLRDLFSQFLERCGICLDLYTSLKESFDLFFEKADSRLADGEGGMPVSVESFRQIFSHPSGVVVNTCHGVKGEEFDTVIAFGLLRGYVPHWDVIINGSPEQEDRQESKLLYVVASRAKRQLHLIAESGRRTKSGRPYETSPRLDRVVFHYD